MTVNLNFSGTASSSYYTAAGTHSITIGAGGTTGTATVTIDPNDNDTHGGDKTVIIGGTSSGLQVKPAPAVTISDNEVPPAVKLSVDPSSITEDAGATNVRATAELDGALLESAVTVKLAVVTPVENTPDTGTASSDDYTLGGTKSITISPGSKTGSTTLVFTPEDDGLYEGGETDTNETVVLMGTADGVGTIGMATITIVDNDYDIVLSLDNDMVSEGADEAVELEVTATLTSGDRSNDITVPLQVGMATGYTIEINDAGDTDEFLTIKAGDLTGTAKITVTPDSPNDDVYSGNMTVDVTANGEDFDLNDKKATITLVEDEDKPTIKLSVDDATITEGGDDQVMVTATLSGEHAEDVTVTLSFDGTAEEGADKDYMEPSNNTITITSGTSSNVTLDFALVDDNSFENPENIVISGTSSPSLDVSSVTVNVEDNDFDVELSFADVTINEAVEDTASVVVTATLQSARTTPLTIALNFSGTASSSEYVVGGTTSITVAPGDAQATGMATVTIDPVDNALRGGDKTIKIGGTAAGVNLKAATQTITIMDDEDAPTVTVKASPATLAEDAGSVSVRITAEVSGGDPLASAAVIELTVDPADVTNTGTDGTPVTMANKNDFTVSGSKSITIPAGAKSGSTTLRVTVVDDALFEQSETITIASKTDAPVEDATADDDTNNIANAAITITDNDFDIRMSVDTSSIAEDASDGVKVKVTATQSGRRSADIEVMIAYEMNDASDQAVAVSDQIAAGGGSITIKAGEMSGETEVTIDPTFDGTR